MNKVTGFLNKHNAIIAPILIVIIIVVIFFMSFNDSKNEITIALYNRIELGMIYKQITSILGEGEKLENIRN